MPTKKPASNGCSINVHYTNELKDNTNEIKSFASNPRAERHHGLKVEKQSLSLSLRRPCLVHVPRIGHSGTKTGEISVSELQEE